MLAVSDARSHQLSRQPGNEDHYRHVVHWATDATLCAECAAAFNLFRHRHHCYLWCVSSCACFCVCVPSDEVSAAALSAPRACATPYPLFAATSTRMDPQKTRPMCVCFAACIVFSIHLMSLCRFRFVTRVIPLCGCGCGRAVCGAYWPRAPIIRHAAIWTRCVTHFVAVTFA